MRIRTLALLMLAACAPAGGMMMDPSVTPRPADTAPAAVEAQASNVVAVYVNASCDSLPTDGQARGTGFWVNATTVATAGHAMDVRDRMIPNFAIVGPDGCMNGRYADWFEHVDLMFIMVSGHHAHPVEMERRLTTPGEPLWQYVFQGRKGSAGRFVPLKITAEKFETSKVFFASRPPPAPGDSGAPVFDAAGKLVGMTQAIGNDKRDRKRGDFGFHLSSLIIRHYLAECAGGGPCGDE